MKIPARRYRITLLCLLLALSGFTIYAHKALEATRGSQASLLERLVGGIAATTKQAPKPNTKPGGTYAATAVTVTSAAALTNDLFTAGEPREPALAPVQSGGTFNITQAVLPGGGGTSNGGTNSLTGAIGQGLTGNSTGGNFAVAGGFYGGGSGGGACPTVANINPTSGLVGASVVITGANFIGMTAVKFSNNVTAAFSVNSATQLTATVPAGAVTGPITLSLTSCADVNTGTFTVTTPPVCPTVTNINPASGQVGSSVTINGTNFTSVTGVKFSNNVNATITNNTGTQLTVTVPAGAVTGPLTISKTGCTDVQTASYTVTTGCPTIVINPATLPLGVAGVPYSQLFTQTGGAGAITWSVSAGALPNGLTLNPATGQFAGLSLIIGTYNFTIRATDAGACTGTQAYTLTFRAKTKADFDGDGKTDLSVWRPSNGNWHVLNSGNAATVITQWGEGLAPYFDMIVPGDYDGDGKTDHAIWRGADEIWYIRKSSDGMPILQFFGTSNAPYFDIPTPGDFDGDGKTDLAVWRPSTGVWFVKKSTDGGFIIQALGQNGDRPVAADYDGDGITDFAIWRPADGNWFIRKSTGGTDTIQWGEGLAPYFDTPVPADYDGDGKVDLAIWRGADEIWYIRPSATPALPILKFYGTSNAPYFDVPTPGDYDGDGKADIGVWRPSTGTWFIRISDTTNMIRTLGQNGDKAVPANGVRW